MRKIIVSVLIFAIMLSLAACSGQGDLYDMESAVIEDRRCILWDGRIYEPFCVVSKKDRGELLGYVDGDTDDRVSEYKGYSCDEWIVSWLPMDGGAMLMKEQSVVDIPDGLEAEY